MLRRNLLPTLVGLLGLFLTASGCGQTGPPPKPNMPLKTEEGTGRGKKPKMEATLEDPAAPKRK